MESRLLLAIHAHATPLFDELFRASHLLGAYPFCTAFVLVAALVHRLRGERREAAVWLVAGLGTAILLETLKVVVARARPELWPRLVTQGGYSFPSGHALASATFYPLLAYVLTRSRPRLLPLALALGVAMAFFIGFGRLYLGLHWPTDVASGWALGGAQSALAITWLRRSRPTSPSP